jgi:SAM-dependent methyltransferase
MPQTRIDAENQETWSANVGEYRFASGWCDGGEGSALAAVAPFAHDQPLLDVGVGGGRTTSLLQLISSDYVAIDYTAAMVDLCRANHPGVEVHHADARDLSRFEDKRFALVYFSFNGIDAIEHDDRRLALSEFFRVLRPGGHVLFSTLNKDGPGFRSVPWRGIPTLGSRPYRVARFIGRLPFRLPGYVASYRNWRRNRSEHADHGDWGLRTFSAHQWRLVVHFITLAGQLHEMKDLGFEMIATLDGNTGRKVTTADDVSAIPWFYVLGRKPVGTTA